MLAGIDELSSSEVVVVEVAEEEGYTPLGEDPDHEGYNGLLNEESEPEDDEECDGGGDIYDAPDVETGGFDEETEVATTEEAGECDDPVAWTRFGEDAAEDEAHHESTNLATDSASAAGAAAGAAASEEGWTEFAACGFDDDAWAEGFSVTDGQAGWVADFDVPEEAEAMPDAEVDLIKETMATLEITPPPWVRKMQQMARIQAMQQAAQHAAQLGGGGGEAVAQLTGVEGDAAAQLSGGGAAPTALPIAPAQHWAEQMQQRAPHAHLLSTATISAASPLPAALAPSATRSLSGVAGARRVTSRQLADERRKMRAGPAGGLATGRT